MLPPSGPPRGVGVGPSVGVTLTARPIFETYTPFKVTAPSAQHLLSKANGYARRTAGEAPAQKQKLADYGVQKPKPSIDARPARCETNAA